MLHMNEEMKKIVSSQFIDNSAAVNQHTLINSIVGKTRAIQCCVIYDEENIEESKIDFKRIFKFVNNWTGYEISCNEIRIEKKDLPSNQYVAFANMFAESLKKNYTSNNFVVYMIVDDDYIELRFHIYREDEGLWLNSNLNVYNCPILYVC